MRIFGYLVAVIVLAGFSSYASAHEYRAGTLFVHHPAVNATPPGADVASGYFSVKNNGDDDDELLGVEAPGIADKVEIHSVTMNQGIMQMRKLNSVPILARTQVDLSPEGIHLMFIGLKASLEDGQKYDGILHFQKAGDVKVYFAVEPIAALPETGAHHHHDMSDEMNPSHKGAD